MGPDKVILGLGIAVAVCVVIDLVWDFVSDYSFFSRNDK